MNFSNSKKKKYKKKLWSYTMLECKCSVWRQSCPCLSQLLYVVQVFHLGFTREWQEHLPSQWNKLCHQLMWFPGQTGLQESTHPCASYSAVPTAGKGKMSVGRYKSRLLGWPLWALLFKNTEPQKATISCCWSSSATCQHYWLPPLCLIRHSV